jgi:hypothetical protein
MTTRQAGADQLFGSYPSRADGSGLPKLDDLALFPSMHGIINVPSDAIGSCQQRRIDLVNVAHRHVPVLGMADESFDSW